MGSVADLRFASRTALATAAIGIVAFALGLIAVPPAGANCQSNCSPYPYLDLASRWPQDFLWQLPAIGLVLGYVALAVCIHRLAPNDRLIGLIGLCLALVSATTLAIDYYVQFAVVPVSLLDGETNGLPLLIQYNPHGLFIALEELGYWSMSISFVLMSGAIVGAGRLMAAARWTFRVPVVVGVAALAVLSAAYGLERQDRFEIVFLSACWLALIANGLLLGIAYRRQAGVSIGQEAAGPAA